MFRSGEILAAGLMLIASGATAQPAPDRAFAIQIGDPAFGEENAPVLCFDGGHENYHRADDLYAPFVSLIERDGVRTKPLTGAFAPSSLSGCDLLAIVSPVDKANADDWALPIASAFKTDELVALHGWVRAGGGLLLIVDHHPIPMAANALLTMLGVAAFDGEARNDPGAALPDLFTRDNSGLRAHAITDGKNPAGRIETVATWTGHAFMASREFAPLLIFGEKSRAWHDLSETDAGADWRSNPVFEAGGWVHAAARPLGEGRVVVLGEAAMCTAQINDGVKLGMNAAEAPQNAQFCLNVVRWLAGVLEPGENP